MPKPLQPVPMSERVLPVFFSGWLFGHPDRSEPFRQRESLHQAATSAGEDTGTSDTEVLSRLRTGDTAAFEAVYRTYVPRLLDFAERYVASDIAEDVVQSVFAAVWRRRQQLEVQTSLTAYLFGSVHREILSRGRHQRVVLANSMSQAPVTGIAQSAPPAPDVSISLDEIMTALRAAIATLPQLTREVLSLRWVEELQYEEIAHVLGISVSAAKMHVHRAQPVVRPFLEKFRTP